jgi:hypothetical protein
MTAQEAFERQLIEQLGSACLTIAKQAAAVTELQNKLDDAEKRIAEMESKAGGLQEI